MRRLILWGLLPFLFFSFWVFIQNQKHQPRFIYMPDMVYSPAVKAQSEAALRVPLVPGTVSRDFQAYPYGPDEQEKAGRELKNPLVPSMKVLERGKKVYETYCLVCHGKTGAGEGTLVPRFPKPPSILSEKVRAWSDGMLYHQITWGKNLMSGYQSQILPKDRWASIYYIRALQRSQNPTPEDLQAFEGEKK